MEPERLRTLLHGLSEMSCDPIAMAKMRADTVNARPGGLTGYDCPKCMNRGSIALVSEDARFVIKECGCMTIRRCMWELEKSGLKQVVENCSFQNFTADAPWKAHLLERCRSFAQKPEGWLVLCGQSGCGKTHLCSAVCHSLLMEGRQVRYLSWREFTVQIKGLTGEYDRQTEVLMPFKEAQVLYIDDLFKCGGTPTTADISLAFELINYRYHNRLTTVISTEYFPQELVKLDEATGGRIIELAGSYILTVGRDRQKNHRLRSAIPRSAAPRVGS